MAVRCGIRWPGRLARISVAGITVLLVCGVVMSQVRGGQPAAISTPDELVFAVNALRAANGMAPYVVNAILTRTAQAQAEYMASIRTWTHLGPGGSTVTDRLLAAGYPLAGDITLGGFRSENVIEGSGMTAAQAVEAWTGDAPHLMTMLSEHLVEIGAGVAESNGVFYYVIDCARPTSSGMVPAQNGTPVESGFTEDRSELIAPVVLSTPDGSGRVYHIVEAGQSLWQIAMAYGVRIAEIRSLNRLSDSEVVQPGMRLKVREVAMAAGGGITQSAPSPTSAVSKMFPSPGNSTWARAPVLDVAEGETLPNVTSEGQGSAGGIGLFIIGVAAAVLAGVIAWASRRS